jgi:hypothetical protein
LGERADWQTVAVPKPEPKKIPENRPEAIVRRESKRQQTLAERKAQEPPPDPAKLLIRTEVCAIEGFNSWSECTVPINVVLIRETYGDGHQDQWALMDTRPIPDPVKPREQYGLRAVIEERHRILKCFHDLSDFSSRRFNVIVAQVVFILLSYTLRQWQLWKLQQERLAGKTPGFLERELSAHAQFVVIYYEHAYAQMPVLTFTREVLELAPEAQAKALSKVRCLEQTLLSPLVHLRAAP